VASIKARVRDMTPQAQQQFLGGLSPRSQEFVAGSPSPRLQTL
jgi:hypothetical protein